ncbi:hypothetical protein GCM10010472_18430 [Pseudonocardia halophobica]|uniref:AAA+ ATPase domain-containing protein n=1 Tax=Pseudonocardia halophobica TaxID=29401 RepID=A0A9W6NUU9_9PSEU|nr:AAA family ATPase [Pseudonocardia halophobica]GLL09943.1 hypothetical protein GCM10017577_10830 [Pseudonocardia halophobica]
MATRLANSQKIDLGAPAAERDITRGLEHYFVESGVFRRVLSGETTVILGNRGAGKSAIFQMLARRSRAAGHKVIELSPDDYSYEMLGEAMHSEKAGSWAKHGAYAAAWKYMLYVQVMKEICTKQVRSKNASEAAIRKYIRDNHHHPGMGKLWALISYLKRLEGIKIGNVEGSIKMRELEKLYKVDELRPLLPHLRNALTEQRVIVIIDELDKGWDASEDARAFISGLFQACITLNQLSPNLRTYVSLRQELYENTPALYEDAQKYRDLVETVSWNEQGLQSLIARRIRHSLPRLATASDQECWNVLFDENLHYRRGNSFGYMVSRTLHRPREMILFCAQALQTAEETSAALPLNYRTIAAAESDYSHGRTHDVAAEQRFQYRDILSVFEAFRGRTTSFDREALEWLMLEIISGEVSVRPAARAWLSGYDENSLIEVLWRVGFLQAQMVGGIRAGRRSGSSYVAFHESPALDLRNVRRFQVHPMFRAYLGMKEGRGRSRGQDPQTDTDVEPEAVGAAE